MRYKRGKETEHAIGKGKKEIPRRFWKWFGLVRVPVRVRVRVRVRIRVRAGLGLGLGFEIKSVP